MQEGVYINGQSVLRLLEDIKKLWDEEGFGSDEKTSEPLYQRLSRAIAEIKGEDE